MCCSVLQCVAVCCSVFQRVAACCAKSEEALVQEMQAMLQCVAACCSVLQRVAPRVRRHLCWRCRPC